MSFSDRSLAELRILYVAGDCETASSFRLNSSDGFICVGFLRRQVNDSDIGALACEQDGDGGLGHESLEELLVGFQVEGRQGVHPQHPDQRVPERDGNAQIASQPVTGRPVA